MPTAVGPNIKGEENLVFGYDTGDTVNSYRGEPTTNLIGNFVNQYNSDYWVRGTNYYQLEATAYIVQDESAPGGAYTYATGNTSDTNAQVFWSAGNTICNEFGQQVSVSAWLRGSGEVRLIAYDDTTGYKSGPAITLTSEWTYHKFSTTFGSGGAQNNHWVGVREITTGEYVHIAKMQWERNPHATQYVRGTRSATQGLIDLTGGETIDLSNVSFDSNAQPDWDGANDYIALSQDPKWFTNEWAYELVFKSDTNNGTYQGLIWAEGAVQSGYSGYQKLLALYNHQYFHYRVYSSSTGGWQPATNFTPSNFTPTNFNHIVWQFRNGTTNIAINGEIVHTNSDRGAYDGGSNSPLFIGARNDLAYELNGQIPYLKRYSRLLTTSEIKANYNAIKGRFNI